MHSSSQPRSPFALLLVIALVAVPTSAEPNWNEILGPTQATLPGSRAALAEAVNIPSFHKTSIPSRVNWEADLPKALREAREQNRPVFVTMRCLPCKACSDFDKDVLEGGGDLDPLLLQFVTVRLTSAANVDLRLLPMEEFQDMDVSWWGWFLSPEGKVYGVFGGRDANGDAGRTSKKALVATLKRVLDHHYDPRRAGWDIDGAAPRLTAAKPATPTDLPGYKNWLDTGHRREHVVKQDCIHCHQVQEIMHQTAIDAGSFDKSRDLDIWPLPENVGIVLERDDGLLIKSVKSGTPASAAGLKPGDVLGAAGGRRLFSQADFRAALHRLPKTGETALDLVYLRDGKVQSTIWLQMTGPWRKTNHGWRISYAEGVVGGSPGFWANDGSGRRERLGLAKDAMCVSPYFPSDQKFRDASPAWQAGLRGSDLIIAVNGKSPNLVGRPWIQWFRMNNDPGNEVTLTVMNQKGEKRDITFRPKQ